MSSLIKAMTSSFKIIIILSGLLSIQYLSSCKSTKGVAEIRDTTADYLNFEHALLWQLDVPGAKSTSYLFGTIHIIGSEDYFLPQGTLAAIDNSEKMVFEIDMGQMNDMSAMMGILTKAFMKDGMTLKDLLSEADYKRVSEHFSAMGLPMFLLERIKPMFLSVLTYGDVSPGGIQSGNLKSYEMEFMQLAANKSLPTAGLETIEYQISIFDSIPYDVQAQMLLDGLDKGDSGNDDFKMMTEMYKNQNINAMVSMIGEDDGGIADFEDVLLHNRNKNWIPQILQMSKEGPVFYAVGAGHLAGEFGVLHLLKKEGVKITPLSQVKK
jgi:uncharacterized protein